MRVAFKHPQLYSDIIRFHKLYWRIHQHLPKDLRVTTGEQILAEITTCLGCVAAANFVNKPDAQARLDELGKQAAPPIFDFRQSRKAQKALRDFCFYGFACPVQPHKIH